MRKTLLATAAAVPMFVAAPAHAAELIGVFTANDCIGQSFSQCVATQAGTNVVGGALPSPVVVKYNGNQQDGDLDPFDVDEISTNYPSVDGNEFILGFDDNSHVASFFYTPGLDDPAIHYFTIKQGRQYALFYDANPILSGAIDLDGVGFSAGTDSFSHMTFFNSGNAVPEPATWAMILFGFGAIGFAMRRRKDTQSTRRLRPSYS
jgi:hypothetical protein